MALETNARKTGGTPPGMTKLKPDDTYSSRLPYKMGKWGRRMYLYGWIIRIYEGRGRYLLINSHVTLLKEWEIPVGRRHIT